MRITLVISSLGAGGAERVLSMLANELASRGHEIALITFDDGKTPPFFPLNTGVRWQPLGIATASSSLLARATALPRRFLRLRRRIAGNAPDVVLSFMDRVNLVTLVATLGLKTPVVVAERNDPAMHKMGALADRLRTLTYRRARAITVQTDGAGDYFRPRLANKIVVIPNPVPPPAGPERGGDPCSKRIVAMGRLSTEKGFDLLIEAFAPIAARHPDWRLTIWGEGGERAKLEALRASLGLEERVALPSRTANPAAEMRAGSIFVLSSRYEGFPNVLCEAMANGLPVVSFDCRSGPGAIIQNGTDGWLVPPGDVAGLTAALESLIANPAERARLGANAERITERFSADRIVGDWEHVLAIAAG